MKNYVAIFVVFLCAMFLAGTLSRSQADIAIIACWLAYLCLTWNIVGGFAGQLSMAHPVYVAIGGYTSTLLYLKLGISPWFGMFAGGALASVVAAVLAWINFRRRLPMLTYALITLAITFIAVVLLNATHALGGHDGLLIPRGNDPSTFRFLDRTRYLYIIIAAVALMLLLANYIIRSMFGARLIALRDNQDAARMLGIDVLKTAVSSSAISAFLGAIGGTFYAQYVSVIDPSAVGIELAVQIVLLTAVGGLGTVWGPFLGAVVLVSIERSLDRAFVDLAGVGHLTYGTIILLILVMLRNGVVPWVLQGVRKKRMQRQASIDRVGQPQ